MGDGILADESKIVMRMGIIASGVAALIVFMFGALYSHQADISILKTQQSYTAEAINDMKKLLTEIRTDQIRRQEKENK